jgi:predicted kinase
MPETINPDDFLETERGRVWTAERDIEAWRQAFSVLESTLQSGRASRIIVVCGLQGAGKSTWISTRPPGGDVVYFDAALPGSKHRRPLIEIAQRYGVVIEAVWIKVSLALALERNARREIDKVVPEASIRSVAARFEPPSIEEGFSSVMVTE